MTNQPNIIEAIKAEIEKRATDVTLFRDSFDEGAFFLSPLIEKLINDRQSLDDDWLGVSGIEDFIDKEERISEYNKQLLNLLK